MNPLRSPVPEPSRQRLSAAAQRWTSVALCSLGLLLALATAAGAQVTVYRDFDFRGPHETFDGAVADLGRTAVGNDAASSIDVAPGCIAVLYRDAGFRGRSYEVTRSIPDLRRTGMGNDRVSSIDVRCADPRVREDERSDRGLHRGWERGRRPHADDDRSRDRRTRRESRSEDDWDEEDWGEEDDWDEDKWDDEREEDGDWYEEDWDERRRGRVWGEGRYQSRDDWRSDRRRAVRDGVILFRDVDFRTPELEIYGPIAELDRTPLGNDRLSSLSVPPGCTAILYEHEKFRGRSLEVRGDIADLRRTPIGNDRVSSIAVHCR